LSISFKMLTEGELQNGTPERAIQLVETIATEAIPTEKRVPAGTPVVRWGKKKPVHFDEDPAQVAMRKGWVKEFPGRGQWIYTPSYSRLLETIERILVDEVVDRLGFQPFMVPKLIPLEVMKMMPGYFDSIPEGMYYVCPPPRDPSAFEKFKDLFKITNEVSREELDRVVKEPNYVLDPSQCTPLWYFLSRETIDLSLLPFRFYDRSGWTYRWEGGGVEGLVRLQEFRRVELVYVASPDDTAKIRDSILEESIRVADEIMDLEWRVAAASPFFVREEEAFGFETGDSKDVAAFDLEVYVPYRGPRESSEWLEVTSCFVHKRKFIDSFRIREVKGREIWSGCSGLGISRWVAAFLATHGFDSSSWPERIRSDYREPAPLPRTLEWPKER
jgi:seryl-tRNA synthetase